MRQWLLASNRASRTGNRDFRANDHCDKTNFCTTSMTGEFRIEGRAWILPRWQASYRGRPCAVSQPCFCPWKARCQALAPWVFVRRMRALSGCISMDDVCNVVLEMVDCLTCPQARNVDQVPGDKRQVRTIRLSARFIKFEQLADD